MIRNLFLAGLLAAIVVTTAAAGNESLWLHIKVEEKGDKAETVRINLPMEMVQSVLPLVEEKAFREGKIRIDDEDIDGEDLKKILAAVRDAQDGEYITVENDEESVRVFKEKGELRIHVAEQGERGETVNVRVRMEVLDALLSGEGDELNVAAALELLGKQGAGELVSVMSEESTVRIWVDDKSTIE